MNKSDLRINDLAEQYEVTCDYIIDEFIIDCELKPCTMFFVIIDDCPMIMSFDW